MLFSTLVALSLLTPPVTLVQDFLSKGGDDSVPHAAPNPLAACHPLAEELFGLKETYHEDVVFRGGSATPHVHEMIVTQSPDKTSWSLLLVVKTNNGEMISCMIDDGNTGTPTP